MTLRTMGRYISIALCGPPLDEGDLKSNSQVCLMNDRRDRGRAHDRPRRQQLSEQRWDLLGIDAGMTVLLTIGFLYLRHTHRHRIVA